MGATGLNCSSRQAARGGVPIGAVPNKARVCVNLRFELARKVMPINVIVPWAHVSASGMFKKRDTALLR